MVLRFCDCAVERQPVRAPERVDVGVRLECSVHELAVRAERQSSGLCSVAFAPDDCEVVARAIAPVDVATPSTVLGEVKDISFANDAPNLVGLLQLLLNGGSGELVRQAGNTYISRGPFSLTRLNNPETVEVST